MKYRNFGEFLAAKRNERGIPVRKLGTEVGCAAGFLTDLEKDNRYPPKFEKLERIADVLQLSLEDRRTMYDLAGKKRDDVPPDLPGYIRGNKPASEAIRTARDTEAGEPEWADFAAYLRNRHGGDSSGA